MLYVRTVKTASQSIAVQVVCYEDRKRRIIKHIGSAHNPEELKGLKQSAHKWIDHKTKQQHLFPFQSEEISTLVPIDKLRNLGFRYGFTQEIIWKLFDLLGLSQIGNKLLLDLTLMRIIQPASKLESLKLLLELFGIEHKRADFYRGVAAMLSLKEEVKSKIITFAKTQFAFDFSIVFYDVTTLYFETFRDDKDTAHEKGLRKKGFSKDNKTQQPQIIIGLLVTREGFPVFYDIFEGDTFEGKTFIPSIMKFKKDNDVKTLTVVADAAMISLENIQSLIGNNLFYIVGARVANLKIEQIKEVSKKLSGIDRNSTRIETERGTLVCDFSIERYQKDKQEMEQQIQKATYLLNNPSRVKRSKFLKAKENAGYVINTKLIEKTKLILGIRGYYTNLTAETNETIIKHYHNLWHVEQAFRVAKGDLAMRPIYHFKRQTIEVHVLICFIALAACKFMELKTGRSIKAIIKLLQGITDVILLNALTNEKVIIRSALSEKTQQLLKSLSLSH